MDITPGYLAAYLLGDLNFVELRFKYVASPPNKTTHRIINSFVDSPVKNAVYDLSDIDDLMEHTFDYARDAKSRGVSTERVLSMTSMCIVVRYVDSDSLGRVYVPFDGNNITQRVYAAIESLANSAIEQARHQFEDADADKLRDDIAELKRKLTELEGKLP